MRLRIKETFKFAHRGVEVREYEAGTEVEADDPELTEIATREKWAEDADKAEPNAPENKAGAPRSRKEA